MRCNSRWPRCLVVRIAANLGQSTGKSGKVEGVPMDKIAKGQQELKRDAEIY